MKQIFLKVYPNGKTTTNASVLNFDRENKSGEIVIDYSEVDFLDWDKQLDLIFSDGTTAFITGSGNTLSVPLLEAYLKKGSMTVQPVAKRLVGSEYEKAKWQVVALSVRDSLNVLENDVTVTISIAEQMQAEIDEFKHAEALRVLSEIDRENAETLRLSNESSRDTNESTRQLNESVRVDNEASRISAEANRVAVEQDRVSAENSRVISEQGRASAESSRGVSETNRANAENVRVSSEATRVTAESTRISNENARIANENARLVFEAYNPIEDYAVGNKVAYNGSSYVCIADSTGNLPTDPLYWLLIASKGNTGATGATGATGEQGIPGGNITNASELPFTPTGSLSSTNVQTALAELDSEKASKTQEEWITPTLLNGWTSYPGFPAQYMKDSLGFVHFRGKIMNGTQGSNALNLATGYSPSPIQSFPCPTRTNATIMFRVDVFSSLVIQGASTGDNWIDLSSITFKAV